MSTTDHRRSFRPRALRGRNAVGSQPGRNPRGEAMMMVKELGYEQGDELEDSHRSEGKGVRRSLEDRRTRTG
jgi:hypothetical protein